MEYDYLIEEKKNMQHAANVMNQANVCNRTLARFNGMKSLDGIWRDY